jgi:NADPH2:quinone reductase
MSEQNAPIFNVEVVVMRAVVLSAFGPPEALRAEEVPDPTPGPGQALVDVEIANVTFVETQVRAGRGPNPAMLPALPAIPGNGVGGVVTAVGQGVPDALIGSRVVTATGGSGGYAELVAVDALGLIPVPEGVGLADAVALLADGRTALALVSAAGPRAGETVLVLAAAGGVGTLLVQLAAGAGARVVAAAGGQRKLDVARDLGATAFADYGVAGWADRIRADLGGTDVAFDGVGGQIGRGAFDLVRPGGRYLAFGLASGTFAKVSDAEALSRRVTVVRGAPVATAEMVELTRAALAEAAAGRLRPVIGQTFLLEDAAGAHRAIESRATVGKTLLLVDGTAGSER